MATQQQARSSSSRHVDAVNVAGDLRRSASNHTHHLTLAPQRQRFHYTAIKRHVLEARRCAISRLKAENMATLSKAAHGRLLRAHVRSQPWKSAPRVRGKPQQQQQQQQQQQHSSSSGVDVCAPPRRRQPLSITMLGVGRHPHEDVVDGRSGRYPRKLNEAEVQALLNAHIGCVDGSSTAEDHEQRWNTLVEHIHRHFDEGHKERRHRSAAKVGHLFAANYCRNLMTDALDDVAFTTLQSIYAEQRACREKAGLMYNSRRRYVVGIHETVKALRTQQVACVLLAADVEASLLGNEEPPASDVAGAHHGRRRAISLHESLELLHAACAGPTPMSALWSSSAGQQPSTNSLIPCITCLSRHRMAYAVVRKGCGVSAVAILRAEKSHTFVKLLKLYAFGCFYAYEQKMREWEEEEDGEGGATSG